MNARNDEEVVGAAPGRVNLLGEHTDYNDGFVLPIAIAQSTRVSMRRRHDGVYTLEAMQLGRTERFSLEEPPSEHFATYVYGCLVEARAIGIDVPPVDIRVDSDVLGWFKRQGTGYQTRMNQVLRRYMDVAGQQRARPADPTRRQVSRRLKPGSKRAR